MYLSSEKTGLEKFINLPMFTQLVELLGGHTDSRACYTVVFTLNTGLSDGSLCSVHNTAPWPGRAVAAH